METKISIPKRIGLIFLGLVQVTLALFAFLDLWARPAEDVRGKKPFWIPVILVNWVGPLAYFGLSTRPRR